MTQKKLTVPFLTLRSGEYASPSDESTAIIRYNSVLNRIEVSLDTGPYLPIGSGGGDGYFFDQLVAAPQVAPLLDGYLAYVDGYSTELNKVSVDDLLALGIGGGVASVGASAPLSSTGGTNPVIGFSSWPSNSAGALTNDGLGNLSWAPPSPSTAPGGPADSLQINDGYGGFIGYSGLAWDNSSSTLSAPVLALAEGTTPTAALATGKLWASSADNARPYWTDSSGQAYNLTLDRFNTLSPAASVAIDADPALPVFNSLLLDQDTTFTTANLGPGRSASVRIVADGTTRTLTFPGGWAWLGSGPPTEIASGDVGYLSIVAYGTSDSDVVAAWSYENMPEGLSGTGVNDQVAIWSGAYTQDGSANFTFNGSTLGLVGGISQSAGAVSLAANAASSVTTSAGALTLTSADAATWSTTTGNLAITGGSSLQLAAGAGEVVVNDGGLASNFRVESDTDPNMLFVDGTNNRVGIGTSTPVSALDLASGQLAIPDGTAASPSIAFRDDLNTGIFSPADDIFGIAVNGSEAVRVLESDGTPVMLMGTSTVYGAITVDSADATGIAGVAMLAHANAGTAQQESYRGGQFAGVRSRGDKISPTGVQAGDGLTNIIGAGVRSDGYINYGSLITMKAEETFASTASGGRIEFHTTLSGTSGFATLGGATTERMRITGAGFVGIGTSSPTATLSVAERFRISGSNGRIIEYDNSTPANGEILIGNGTDFGKTTLTAGSGVSIVNGSGSITISATGSGGSVTSVDVSGGTTGLTTSGGPIISSGTITIDGTLAVTHGGTGTSTAFTEGSIVFAGTSGIYDQDNANLFWDNASDRLGIGTASPNERLTVDGSIAISEGSAPASTPAFGKLWADGYSDARPYWTDDTGQEYNLTLDRFNTLTPGASVAIDVNPGLPIFNSLAIDQDTTFTTSNLGDGRSASVRVVCDGTNRNLSFPAGWTWLGSGPPAVIIANDVGYLSIVAYGANDSDVVAAWSYENMPTAPTGSGTDNQIAVWSGANSQDGSASLTFDGSSLVVDAAAVFNESGAAVDFRIESDADANMFFVDGTNNRIGIGTSAPSSTFSVGSTSQFRVSSTGDLERIRDVAYSFPASQGAAGTVLTNDGSGVLSWAASTAGATSAPISTKTSSYVMTTADGTILADATSGAITITLPAAASAAETIFTIKKKDVTSNIVTVDANGAELIDGSTTYDLSTQYEAIKIQSDGSAWWII